MNGSGARVLVVGAGIIGRALAYYLSKAGANVVLIDAGAGISCASRASLGVLTHYSGGFSGYGLFIKDSLAMHESLSYELLEATGMDVGWSRLGGIDLAFDEDDEEKIRSLYEEGCGYGIALERLDSEQICKLDVSVSRNVRSGLFFFDDQRVDPMKLGRALLKAAIEAGTVVHWGERLLEVEHCAFHDISIKTSRARRHADILILASGAWTRGLAHRGKLDNNDELIKFSKSLEEVCINTVESGLMTKDLAVLIDKSTKYLTTNQFLEAIDSNLKKKLN